MPRPELSKQEIKMYADALREVKGSPAWTTFMLFFERYEDSTAQDALDDEDVQDQRGVRYWRGRRDMLIDLRTKMDQLIELANNVEEEDNQRIKFSLSRQSGNLSFSSRE